MVYNVTMLAGFLGSYLLVGMSQLDRNTGSVNFLQNYWAHGFPPTSVGYFLFLCLGVAGLVWLWRKQYRVLVLLCVAPLALAVLVAVGAAMALLAPVAA